MKTKIKNTVILFIIISLISLFSAGCASNSGSKAATGGSKKEDSQDEINKKIDGLFSSVYGADSFSGYVYIVKNNKVLLDKGYGMADFDKKIINTRKVKFQVASLTKQFTALSVMQLQEKGLMNTNDTINKYLPSFPKGDRITVHQLLTHTSGLAEHSQDFDIKVFSPFNKDTSKKAEKVDVTFQFEPGQSFQYSNTGYILLGYIVEKVSGKTLDQYFKENIFEPLDMRDTDFLDKNFTLDNLAVGYATKNKDKVENSWYDLNVGPVRGSSGLCTTVDDLLKWDKGLADNKIINKDSLKQIYTPDRNNYGYGWYIREDGKKNKYYEHYGVSGGYRSYIQRKPSEGTTVIVLSNFGDIPLENIVLRLNGYLSE